MEDIIEQQRQLHEEVDHLLRGAVEGLLETSKTQREKMNSEHKVRRLAERASERSRQLLDMYADDNGSRKEAIESISGPNEMTEFYARLRNIRELHKNSGDELVRPIHIDILHDQPVPVPAAPTEEEEAIIAEAVPVTKDLVEFSGEEGYGKYLDLYQAHDMFINLKDVDYVDYNTFMDTFDNFTKLSKATKSTGAYRSYIQFLKQYLTGFLERSRPLADNARVLKDIEDSFQEAWSQGKVAGWEGVSSAPPPEPLDLKKFSSVEDLEKLGMERLKSALQALGMKCGGTARQRAERLFSVKGVKPDEIDKSLLAKKNNKGVDHSRTTAEHEYTIVELMKLLSDVRQATRDNVVRKQARTAQELEQEEEEAVELKESEDEEDEDEEPEIYNPKKVPLGADGKPIAYWLFKLHGLNVSYECEICGGHVYRGPKAFQEHFSQSRHAHGMRCLGIPNTAHFHNVTKMKDALALWEKLKSQKTQERFNAGDEEEFEDSMGNVINKKTYEDLLKQGLL